MEVSLLCETPQEHGCMSPELVLYLAAAPFLNALPVKTWLVCKVCDPLILPVAAATVVFVYSTICSNICIVV
jgi:hypothetical protein